MPVRTRVCRAAFLGVFVGIVVDAAFGTYQFDKYSWIPVAFAATLEMMDRPYRKANTHVSTPGSTPVLGWGAAI